MLLQLLMTLFRRRLLLPSGIAISVQNTALQHLVSWLTKTLARLIDRSGNRKVYCEIFAAGTFFPCFFCNQLLFLLVKQNCSSQMQPDTNYRIPCSLNFKFQTESDIHVFQYCTSCVDKVRKNVRVCLKQNLVVNGFFVVWQAKNKMIKTTRESKM